MTANEVLAVAIALFVLGLFAALLAVMLEQERRRHSAGFGSFNPELIAEQARRAMDEIHRAAFIAMAECYVRAQAGRHTPFTSDGKEEVLPDVRTGDS